MRFPIFVWKLWNPPHNNFSSLSLTFLISFPLSSENRASEARIFKTTHSVDGSFHIPHNRSSPLSPLQTRQHVSPGVWTSKGSPKETTLNAMQPTINSAIDIKCWIVIVYKHSSHDFLTYPMSTRHATINFQSMRIRNESVAGITEVQSLMWDRAYKLHTAINLGEKNIMRVDLTATWNDILPSFDKS